eukprot:TRINITY_DN8751_c0_g1_i1.p1 TRINITY_DN8751_c0_g1~~TRINITY_DN8751_c0_g1_i1.p1  ORF type:complete len:356 (-),score=64.40 TRINITY_DN8751_c0_g1_i1:535-1602(-)
MVSTVMPSLLTSKESQDAKFSKLLQVDEDAAASEGPATRQLEGLPHPLITQAEWEDFESKVKIPTVYAPPQKNSSWQNSLLYCLLRSPCCCCQGSMQRHLCGISRVETLKVTDPDEAFKRMLAVSNPNCPEHLQGIWWLEDNVAPEGLVLFQDSEWFQEGVFVKDGKYNWTYDGNDLAGLIESTNNWKVVSRVQFETSPNGRWMAINWRADQPRGHAFIYRLQEGDVLRRPDGSLVDFAPGIDMVRQSYETFDPSTPMIYQYLVRRVAHLDDDGNLVKTKYYDKVKAVAEASTFWNGLRNCFRQADPSFRWMPDTQVFALSTPELQGWSLTTASATSAASATTGASAPTQDVMTC